MSREYRLVCDGLTPRMDGPSCSQLAGPFPEGYGVIEHLTSHPAWNYLDKHPNLRIQVREVMKWEDYNQND